eukprot:TRINITY_DN8284_c0_g1_i1.p1 TRINITY_DN8284_c0_g1~~TRINITY_DN8284_c0_g1_i1.p1  ORF type:complete len:199 (+),score=65.65 TRINITY_DN8284_c0_g1_i1:56-652(+)
MEGLVQLLFLLTLLHLLSTPGLADYVGQSVAGEVGEGNYTYYTLKQPGNVQLVLTTLSGDADMYVSGYDQEKPTFMFDGHYISSATCGEDVVSLPYHMRRPVHIGVYGHPRHLLSKFSLEVVVVESREFDPFGENSDSSEYVNSDGRDSHEESYRKQGGGGRGKSGGGSDFWEGENSTIRMIFTILKGILEIVLDIMI